VTLFGFTKHEFSTANRAKATSQTKTKNHQATEACSANLMIEGEAEAFWFYPKCEALIANCTKAISQTKHQT
jgi:hypothetical protein